MQPSPQLAVEHCPQPSKKPHVHYCHSLLFMPPSGSSLATTEQQRLWKWCCTIKKLFLHIAIPAVPDGPGGVCFLPGGPRDIALGAAPVQMTKGDISVPMTNIHVQEFFHMDPIIFSVKNFPFFSSNNSSTRKEVFLIPCQNSAYKIISLRLLGSPLPPLPLSQPFQNSDSSYGPSQQRSPTLVYLPLPPDKN